MFPDSMNAALEDHDEIFRLLLARFRGYEVKTEGDAFVMAFFTTIEALRWCVAAQHALLAHVWPEELLRQYARTHCAFAVPSDITSSHSTMYQSSLSARL